MNAYSLVDGSVRRKLEEMLKTWKEPVPGSMNSRPVFPTEVTRSIDNALIKARTAAVQMQQQQARNDPLGRGRGIPPVQTPPIPFRNTPTPPVVGAKYPPPQTTQTYVPQPNGNGIASIYGGNQVCTHYLPVTSIY
jgi:pre-mRNA cleavage complex 2 protein Pcf11